MLVVTSTTQAQTYLTDTHKPTEERHYKAFPTKGDGVMQIAKFKYKGGFTLGSGRGGLISADLERVNLSKMRLSDNYGYADTFNDVNDDIAQYCSSCNIFRLGGEMNIVNDIALRAGYTGYFYNVPGYQYVSFGIGKRLSENSSLDLAFSTSLADNYNMKPYDDYAFDADGNAACIAPTAGISATFKDLLLTYRVKF